MRYREKAAKGFTLIELLVAISILAIVAVLGWRGLDSIVRARVALNKDLEQARGMQLAFAQMQSDCAHIVRALSIGGRATLFADPGRLLMVRTVFADNQPSRVQVVAYRLTSNKLTRQESVATRDLKELDVSWAAALEGRDNSQAVPLQDGVSAMLVRSWFSDSPGWRVNANNANAAANAIPTGLEVALQLRGNSDSLIKVFLLGPV